MNGKINFSIQRSLKKPESWDEAEFNDRLRAFAISIIFVVLLSFFFYESIYAFFPLLIPGYICYRFQIQKLLRKKKDILKKQFKECILCVEGYLKAGYSIENAFCESKIPMEMMYGRKARICKELDMIRQGAKINIPLKELLRDFGNRSQIDEIKQFAEVVSIGKEIGGNLSTIISQTVKVLDVSMSAKEEIRAALSGKQYEFVIMKSMPFMIFLYLRLGYKGYLDTLYHNLNGVLAMTGVLIIYLFAVLWGDRILMKIEEKNE